MMDDDDEVNEDGWYDRGGIPDWLHNDSASDQRELAAAENLARSPKERRVAKHGVE